MDAIEIDSTRSRFTKPYSLNIVVPLTVIYGIIFVAGVLVNITTCIVIVRNRILHTATNHYLFCLAVSDLLLLLCGLPLEVYRLWQPFSYPLGEYLCITLVLISETSTNATVLIIAALNVNRYVAIYHPITSHNLSKLSKVVKYIIAIWICSLCFALPQVMQFGIVTYEENGQLHSACILTGQGSHQVFALSSFVFFIVPMSSIIVLYVLIGIKIRRGIFPAVLPITNVGRSNVTRLYRNEAFQRKAIRKLVAVTLSFFLCWVPFHVQRLITVYGKNLDHPTDTFDKFYIFLTHLSGVLYYVSTTINLFLYNIMSKKIRNAFKVTLLSWCCRRDGLQLDRTSRAILVTLMEGSAARALQRSRQTPLQSRRSRSTASSQQCDEPPLQEQCLKRTELYTIYEENESELSSTSSQSISNSSLRKVDQELIGEELTTYLYQVNRKITGNICASSV